MKAYGASAWGVLTIACYLSGTLLTHWPLPLALLVSVLPAGLLFQVPLCTVGTLLPNRNNIRFNSIVYMLLLLAAALYFARSETWLRFVAWQSLALLVFILSMRARILAFAAIAPVALVLLWPYSPIAAVGVLALSHALLLYPTLTPNAQWLGPVITSFDTARPEVWLTIDDGPTSDTPALLDVFDRHEVKATFFVKGALADERPDVIREIVARGHSVANHSHTHPSGTFWCALPSQVRSEIMQCNETLETLTGARPRWFRAPVGHKNPFVHPVLERERMQLIGWTSRGYDAVWTDPARILSRLLPHVKPGAIVVLHQGREHSLRVVEQVITAVKERGYSFVIPDAAALRNTNR